MNKAPPHVASIFAGFADDPDPDDYGSLGSVLPLSENPARKDSSKNKVVNWRVPESDQDLPSLADKSNTNSSGSGTASAKTTVMAGMVNLRRMFASFVGGVISFMTTCVVIICFAASVCAPSQRLSFYQSSIVQFVATGTVIGGILSGQSKLPFLVPTPDLFCAPFFACVAGTLDGAIPDSSAIEPGSDGRQDIFVTFLVVCMVMVAVEGILLCASTQLQLLRVGDYVPFPVVQGLVAGTAIGIARSAIAAQRGSGPVPDDDTESDDYILGYHVFDTVWIGAAVATATLLLVLEMRCGIKPGGAYLPVFFLATAIFYLSITIMASDETDKKSEYASAMTISVTWGKKRRAFFPPENLDSGEGHFFALTILDLGRIRWDAAMQCSGCVFNYLILNLLRVFLQFQATVRAIDMDKKELDMVQELMVIGATHVANGLFCGLGSIPFLAGMTMLKAMNDDGGQVLFQRVPGIVCTILIAVLLLTTFSAVTIVPKFIFTALLFHTSAKLLHQSFFGPLPTLDWKESAIVVAIVVVSQQSVATAVGLGAASAALLFVYAWMEAGCIKYESSGILWRSSVERPEVDVEWLEKNGDTIQIFQLQGFIFFGNAQMLLDRVDNLLQMDDALREEQRGKQDSESNAKETGWPYDGGIFYDDDEQLALGFDDVGSSTQEDTRTTSDKYEPLLAVMFIILDLTLVMGLDHSALVALEDTVAAAKKRKVTVVACGVSKEVLDRIRRSKLKLLNDDEREQHNLGRGYAGGYAGASQSDQSNFKLCNDLDSALSWCEDAIIRKLGSTTDRAFSFRGDFDDEARDAEERKSPSSLAFYPPFQPMSSQIDSSVRSVPTGFRRWLSLAAERHGGKTILSELEILEKFMTQRSWKRGDEIMSQQHGSPISDQRGDSGLSFIVEGLISKRRDPQQSLKTKSALRLFKQGVNRQALHSHMREFQFARFGPGWCIGLEDVFTGMRSVGKFEAETDCVVLFLPFNKLEYLKQHEPKAVLELFHLLGRLLSSQHNRTKERLSHVMDAMSARKVQRRSVNRRTLRLAYMLGGELS